MVVAETIRSARAGRRTHAGFTLVELLVVIAIIGVLVSLLLPAVQAAREAARRMQCTNNLKQLGLGIHNYESTYRTIPITYFQSSPADRNNECSWQMGTLPFLEQGSLYDLWDFRFRPLADPRNGADLANPVVGSNVWLLGQILPVFHCPSESFLGSGVTTGSNVINHQNATWNNVRIGLTNYRGVMGANYMWGQIQVTTGPWATGRFGANQGHGYIYPTGMFARGDNGQNIPTRFRDVIDGLSNTLMVGEATHAANALNGWYHWNGVQATCVGPINRPAVCPTGITLSRVQGWIACRQDWSNNEGFHSQHPGGANFTMGDGSVRFIAETIDLVLYRSLSTCGGGEAISGDF